MNRYPHIAARLLGVPLAIEPGKLRAILESLGPRLGLAAPGMRPAPAAMEDDDEGGPSFAERQRAAMLQRYATIVEGEAVEVAGGMGDYILTPGGVAIVPIVGALVQRFDWLSALCGLTSYDAIGATLDQALADYRVKGVLLDVDSPGGECNGCFDLADRIYAARGDKPIWASANALAASAAYALASVTDRIAVPQVGYVGSVGVVAVHLDRSKEDQMLGRRYTAIYSGARKIDGWDHAPLSDEAAKALQAEVDTIRGIFADSVARGRGMTAEAVLGTEADVFLGAPAVEIGFADEVAPFEEFLASLHAEITPPAAASFTRAAAARNSKREVEAMDPKKGAAKPKAGEPGEGGEKPAEGTAAPAGGDKPAESAAPAGSDKPAESAAPAGGDKPAEAAATTSPATDAAAIVDMVELAGEKSTLAAEFIRKGLSLAQVTAQLAERRNARLAAGVGAKPIDNKHAPGVDPAPGASWEAAYDRVHKQFGV